jgi:hypothetical protein
MGVLHFWTPHAASSAQIWHDRISNFISDCHRRNHDRKLFLLHAEFSCRQLHNIIFKWLHLVSEENLLSIAQIPLVTFVEDLLLSCCATNCRPCRKLWTCCGFVADLLYNLLYNMSNKWSLSLYVARGKSWTFLVIYWNVWCSPERWSIMRVVVARSALHAFQ